MVEIIAISEGKMSSIVTEKFSQTLTVRRSAIRVDNIQYKNTKLRGDFKGSNKYFGWLNQQKFLQIYKKPFISIFLFFWNAKLNFEICYTSKIICYTEEIHIENSKRPDCLKMKWDPVASWRGFFYVCCKLNFKLRHQNVIFQLKVVWRFV